MKALRIDATAQVGLLVVLAAACSSAAGTGDTGWGAPQGAATNAASGSSGGQPAPAADAGSGASGSSSGAKNSSGSGGAATSVSSSGGTGSGDAGHAGADAQAEAAGKVSGDSGGLMGVGDGGACPAPPGITAQQATALQIINQTRAAMGSPCATEVPTLMASATNHCNYYAMNANATGNCNAKSNPHGETAGCPGFTGVSPGNREQDAGYTSLGGGSEVMAFNDDPTAALGQWIGSIYHRTPTLDPWTRDFGYGSATMCDTIDFGSGAGSSTPGTTIVSYPYDGQTGVGLTFNGNYESPMPPAPPNGWPSGYPIHVYMQASTITLTTDEFGIDGGSQLTHQVLLPQNSMNFLINALVLYGDAPLSSQTTYRVHVAGTRQTTSYFGPSSSVQFDVSFAFTTQ